MKKNAVVIAGIMFVAGCATNQARYSSDSADPSLSAQYDPATGGYPSSSSGSENRHLNNTSVNDFHADSSIRGGSNEARGWAQRDFLPTEGASHPINPAVQADSSIRGGSMKAREIDQYHSADSSGLNTASDKRIRADSSIRGGSNEARYGHSFRSSSDQALRNPDRDRIDNSTSFDYVLVPTQPRVASDESVQSSPNWNPSDDLLPDGVQTQPADVTSTAPNNDASIGGAASSESGSGSSKSTLDDIEAPSQRTRAETDTSTSLSSPGSQKDLNASSRLEKDIGGEYNLDEHRDDLNFSSTSAVGGPGSTETGVATSGDSNSDSAPREVSKEGADHFRNNRAQGVGSAASGELGSAHSTASETQNMTDSQLAEKVKGTLTREESGTSGVTQREITRNVQVTSLDGTVVLKGTVPSQKAKDVLELRAREIAGVRKVDNQLTVTSEANPSIRDLNIGRNLEDSTDQVQNIQQ